MLWTSKECIKSWANRQMHGRDTVSLPRRETRRFTALHNLDDGRTGSRPPSKPSKDVPGFLTLWERKHPAELRHQRISSAPFCRYADNTFQEGTGEYEDFNPIQYACMYAGVSVAPDPNCFIPTLAVMSVQPSRGIFAAPSSSRAVRAPSSLRVSERSSG